MPTYDFTQAAGNYIRDLSGNFHTTDAEVYPIIGAVSACTAEPKQTVSATAPGEYSITTTGTATSFVFYFPANGDYSLVPAP